MAYTGDVTVGGAPDTRELPGLTVTKVAVGPMDNGAYLLRCTQTGTAVLIDAANEADRLLELIGDTPVSSIVTTHRHWDHWQALPEVASATGAVVIAHPDDAAGLPVPATSLVRGGDRVVVGATSIAVIHLRGHTPGSALCYDADGALADSPHLFTGDSLFPGGPGTPRATRSGSTSSWTTWRSGCSPCCPMPPGSTRATARTPRWGRSARTWRSGANGAGSAAGRAGRGTRPARPGGGPVSGPGRHRRRRCSGSSRRRVERPAAGDEAQLRVGGRPVDLLVGKPSLG